MSALNVDRTMKKLSTCSNVEETVVRKHRLRRRRWWWCSTATSSLTLLMLVVVVSFAFFVGTSSIHRRMMLIEQQGRQHQQQQQQPQPRRRRKRRRPTVAYASSITSCSIDNTINDVNSNNTQTTTTESVILDTAAVFLQSIRRLIRGDEPQYYTTTEDDIYLFLHPDATGCRPVLERLGYQVIVKDIPFDVKKIKSKALRRKIDSDGCCGRDEFIKLWPYTLTQYDFVIHTDLDVLFLQSLDPVIRLMSLEDEDQHDDDGTNPSKEAQTIPEVAATSAAGKTRSRILGRPYIGNGNTTAKQIATETTYPSSEVHEQQLLSLIHLKDDHQGGKTTKIPSRVDFAYTRDYLQRSRWHTDPKKYGVQGGFFIVRPNQTIFEQMIETITHSDYSHGSYGWGQKGYGGYWGQSQIQGFLSYFYGEIQPDHASLELNRCRVNAMINDKPYLGGGGGGDDGDDTTASSLTSKKATTSQQQQICRTGQITCEDCRATPLDEMINVHLTTCWKPWTCPKLRSNAPPQCKEIHQMWFQLRQELETSWAYDLPPKTGFRPSEYLGYCTDKGPEHYIKMKIPLPKLATAMNRN